MEPIEIDVLVQIITHPEGQCTVKVLGTADDYDREITIYYHPTYTDHLGEERPAYTYDDLMRSVWMRGSENVIKDVLYRFHKKQPLIYNGEANYAPCLGLYRVETQLVKATV